MAAMKNKCLKCGKEFKILYPGDLCPGCYSEKIPGSNELKNAWKTFMKGASANRMINSKGKDSEVVSK